VSSFVFVVEKVLPSGKRTDPVTLRDSRYMSAVRRAIAKRGWKVAMLRVTRPAYPTTALHYRVRAGEAKYEGWSPVAA